MKFAKEHVGKTKAWWLRHVQMHIDVKHFQVYLNGKARHHAAQLGCRGAYRGLGDKLSPGYVKPSKTLKYNSGARGVKVLGGVGGGKVLLWSAIDGKWNGDVAAKMYTGPVRQALLSAYPNKRRFVVLEDNDPSGFKSGKGRDGKSEACVRRSGGGGGKGQ